MEARHGGGRIFGFGKGGVVGYVVEGPRRVYCAGDTALFDGMRDLATDLDVALLPIWGWGPTLGPGHLDPEAAAKALGDAAAAVRGAGALGNAGAARRQAPLALAVRAAGARVRGVGAAAGARGRGSRARARPEPAARRHAPGRVARRSYPPGRPWPAIGQP